MAEQSLTDILENKLKPYFDDHPLTLLAYLFGSYGRNQPHAHSDVDVAVLLTAEADCFEIRLQIMADLSTILQRNDIDVVILNQAPLVLAYRVIRDGRLLSCRSQTQRVKFVAETMVTYLDFQPLVKRHEKIVLERASKGHLTYGYNPHHGALDRYRQRRQRLEIITSTEL